MLLYHGTPVQDIDFFKREKQRNNLDFGKGIYFSFDKKTAEKWSVKDDNITGAVYECDINISNLDILTFDCNSDEDLYYLCYLCRLKMEFIADETIEKYENCDAICGLMAKNIKGFIKQSKLFNNGDITFEKFKNSIQFYKRIKQICFKSDRAISLVNNNIKKVYFTKKDNNKEVKIYLQKNVKYDLYNKTFIYY